jgi:hypothetical protein
MPQGRFLLDNRKWKNYNNMGNYKLPFNAYAEAPVAAWSSGLASPGMK